MKTDCYGAPVSEQAWAAIEGLNGAQRNFRGYFGDPLAEVDAVLAAYPDFVMAHCFRGGLFATSSEAGCVAEIKKSLRAIERNWAAANDRERGHYAALSAWASGEFHDAANKYGQIAARFPRDAIALQFAHLCDFLNGHATQLRDRVAGVLPQWREDEEGYGYLLGMHAFGLEETGDYARAEETGRKAIALNPADSWAVHAVAHVMEMQGRHEHGAEWLGRGVDHWAPENFFAFHNFWHLALFHLETDDHAGVLELYDRHIRTPGSTVAMELVDAAALLWRLHLRGVDVGDRWTAVSEAFDAEDPGGYYAFNDMHAVMAHLAADRSFAAEKRMARLTEASKGFDTNAMMTRRVGQAATEGMVSFFHGDYGRAVSSLMSVRAVSHLFGGSNAQRDILGLTLVEAAIRNRQSGLAVALASERLGLKPDSPPNRRFLQRAWTTASDTGDLNQVA